MQVLDAFDKDFILKVTAEDLTFVKKERPAYRMRTRSEAEGRP